MLLGSNNGQIPVQRRQDSAAIDRGHSHRKESIGPLWLAYIRTLGRVFNLELLTMGTYWKGSWADDD